MFRRKEEGLFDNDPIQTDIIESANVISPAPQPAAAPAAPASAQSFASANTAPSAAINRPAAPVAPASSFRTSAPAAPAADLTRNRMPEANKPLPASLTNPTGHNSAAADKSNKSGRRVLTVGSDILLKGEIATCDRLVIEGKVDATLNDVHTVEIAETGSFKGSARIEDAEISGLFEGDLVVSGRLVIYATGKVRGKITYGEIEIERGGELSGEIKNASSAAASAPRPAARKQDDKVAA